MASKSTTTPIKAAKRKALEEGRREEGRRRCVEEGRRRDSTHPMLWPRCLFW